MFHMNSSLPVDTIIRFRIVLPAAVLGADTDVLVNCTGRVVRCLDEQKEESNFKDAPGKKAVAAVIDEYNFERVFSHAG
jgi:hypothetical protein